MGREINNLMELIKKGENERIEFKESLSLKDEIGISVSSFANFLGGVVLIGVKDSGEIRGAEIGKDTIESLANYIKQHTDNSIYPSISAEKVNEKNVLVVRVDESNEKPVFFKRRAYIRAGKSVHSLSHAEIKKMVRESSFYSWDGEICANSTLKDIDKDNVEWYLNQREEHRNVPKNKKMPLKVLLNNIGVVRDNKPTNAGILFFGSNSLLQLPQSQLRLVRIRGGSIDGLILDRKDCEGTLWEMVGQAEEFLRKHINFIGIRTSNSFQRKDKFDIPLDALKELVINALIHRDYETKADTRVFIFDDRIEIVNPGSFPQGVTPQKPVHRPVNPLLSQYMYDTGFIEKYGSGIIKARNLLRENGNKDLSYGLHKLETRAIIYSQLEKDLENLTTNQRAILREIRENPRITQEKLSKAININEKNIRNNIAKLRQQGLLKRVGPAKGGHWEIIKGSDNINDEKEVGNE